MADANGMSIIGSDIKNQDFAKVYLLGGTEEYLVSQYTDNLVEALIDKEDSMNFVAYKGDGVKTDALAEFVQTMPFFADRRVVLVVDSDFFKKGNEEVEKLIDDIPDTTVLIFSEHNIDKRCKLYKQVAKVGRVAMFDAQDERTLAIWVKSLFSRDNVAIEDKVIYRLIESVGTDMNTLYKEVEKLKCYGLEKGSVSVEDVEALSINQIEGKIFDMMDALSQRNKKLTMELYSDLLKLREPAMRLLFLITRQFNILLKTKLALSDGADYGKIASSLKLPPFTIKKYVSQSNAYTYEQLIEKVNLCQQADSDIKSGVMRDGMAVEMLVVKLLQ
ncbi:MAG: DNA polymerase III subunit delta [Lachnospiraceae bacterium]|nr:DNA polymerase III subunit delta [Lachnospiraceae bacterium]